MTEPKPPRKRKPHTEAQKEKRRDRYAGMHPADKLVRVWRQMARPPTPTIGSFNSTNPRKFLPSRAYYPWSDHEEVVRTYMAAAVLTELTGELYVVDHVVPLVSPLVCGLHTHDNLRVLRADENNVKSNIYWPGMWPVEWGTLALVMDSLQYPRA